MSPNRRLPEFQVRFAGTIIAIQKDLLHNSASQIFSALHTGSGDEWSEREG